MVTLSDVCYEHIKDTFHYGILGDFKLVIDKSTDCFNATKLCQQCGKDICQWKRLARSKRLMEVLGVETYEVAGGNRDDRTALVTGQYVPKELILDITSWISPRFYVRCNDIIISYFSTKLNTATLREKDEKIAYVEKEMERLALENKELLSKMNVALEDRAPQPEESSKSERFILLKRCDKEDFPYYVIRAQRDTANSSLRKQKKLYSNVLLLLDLNCHPNSKTLYVRIKEDLKKKMVKFNRCDISISESDVSEEELIQQMKKIDDSKRSF